MAEPVVVFFFPPMMKELVMKFRVDQFIRHVNGVQAYRVHSVDRINCVYGLKKPESPVIDYYAATHVDHMYVVSVPESQAEFEEMASSLLGYEAKPDAESSADVTVSLPGLPAGYYLKAFRKASLGELILNTNGAVRTASLTIDKKLLYRPIVGRMSDLTAPTPQIPGIPLGWLVVAYRKPVAGEYCIRLGSGGEVFQCEHDDWASRQYYLIVRRKPNTTPCDGTLPGIPKEFKLVKFGDVGSHQFYLDSVGELKNGPAENRLVLEKRVGVITEYEIYAIGATAWAVLDSYCFPSDVRIKYTGRTRKVVVQ